MLDKLAQATSTNGEDFGIDAGEISENADKGTEAAAQNSGFISEIISVIFGAIAIICVLGSIVAWVYAFIDLVRREETSNNKVLWAFLIFFVAPIGHIIYFFVEDRKKWGIWSVVFVVVPILSLILWSLIQLILA
ncbi:MAG: PLDc N-terminal domain-containing protein [Candidatus Paceibacteria bacterium]